MIKFLFCVKIFFIILLLFMIHCQSDKNDLSKRVSHAEITELTDTIFDVVHDDSYQTKIPSVQEKIEVYRSNNPNSQNLKTYKLLIDKLVKAGFDKDYLITLFSNELVRFIPCAIDVNIGYNSKLSSMLEYSRPSYKVKWDDENVKINSETFNNVFEKALDDIEKRYTVNREVVIAILWTESNFGKNFGVFPVFNVYASLALMENPTFLNEKIKELAQENKNINKAKLKKTILRKSKWGFAELKYLLKIDQKTNINILQLLGSYAGAFGFSQFIPSSYVALAKDGNYDSIIDLFNVYDAIESVANYLKKAGWKNDNQSSQSKAILAYNHSTPYLINIVGKIKSINPNYQLDISTIVESYHSKKGNNNQSNKNNVSQPKKDVKKTLKEEIRRQLLLNSSLF